MVLTRVDLVLSVPIAVLGHTGSTNTKFNFPGLDSLRSRFSGLDSQASILRPRFQYPLWMLDLSATANMEEIVLEQTVISVYAWPSHCTNSI